MSVRFAVLVFASLVLACTDKPENPDSFADAPPFEARTLEGDDVDLAGLRGTVVLINVWATWCEPCVAELPVLGELHRDLSDRGFTVIGLNTDVASKRLAVKRMVSHHELPFPIWLDPTSQSQVAFELRGYPTSVLVDRAGKIRWRREGVIVRGDPELMPVLERVLNE